MDLYFKSQAQILELVNLQVEFHGIYSNYMQKSRISSRKKSHLKHENMPQDELGIAIMGEDQLPWLDPGIPSILPKLELSKSPQIWLGNWPIVREFFTTRQNPRY